MPATATSTHPAPAADRLSADDRRDALLDSALALVRDTGQHDVTMGTVAAHAGVTRALVYKHFANREELLGALYRREAAALDRVLRRGVDQAPDGFEPKVRAFIGGVLGAVDTHATFFNALRPFRSDPAYRTEQRAWDRRTSNYFAGLAEVEFGLDRQTARSAMGVLLTGVDSLLAQARADHSPEHLRRLEDLFLTLATGALTQLTGPAGPATRSQPD